MAISYKKRLIRAFPVFSKMLIKSPLVRMTIVPGAAAGAIAVSAILSEDELISVIDLTDSTDVTSEFSITANAVITGTAATTGKSLLVLWHPWTVK